MSRPAEHHAKLIVHHLSGMSDALRERTAEWLEEQAKLVRDAKPGQYTPVFTARLMK